MIVTQLLYVNWQRLCLPNFQSFLIVTAMSVRIYKEIKIQKYLLISMMIYLILL